MSSPIVLLVLSTIPSARAADYTGDHIDDLVVGVPNEQIGRGETAGAIQVIRGSSTGLTTTGDAFLHQETTGVGGTNEPDELFGIALAAGDVDGDGKTDVIVGAPAGGGQRRRGRRRVEVRGLAHEELARGDDVAVDLAGDRWRERRPRKSRLVRPVHRGRRLRRRRVRRRRRGHPR